MILLHFKERQKDGSVPASVQLTRMKQIRWSKALLIQQVLIHRRLCDKAEVGVTPDYCCPPGVKSISYTPQSLILRYKELCWSEVIGYTELALNIWYLVYKKWNKRKRACFLLQPIWGITVDWSRVRDEDVIMYLKYQTYLPGDNQCIPKVLICWIRLTRKWILIRWN